MTAEIFSEIQQAAQPDQRRCESSDRLGRLLIEHQPCQALAEQQRLPFGGSPIGGSRLHAPVPGAGVEVVESFPGPWPLLFQSVDQDVHWLSRWLTVQGGLEIEFPSIDGGETLALHAGLTGEIEECQSVGRQRLQAMTIRTRQEQQGRRKVLKGETRDLGTDLLGPLLVV